MTNCPRTSFSRPSNSRFSNSGPCSTDSSIAFERSSSAPPNSENCPAASARRSDRIGPTTFSKPSNSARRAYPSESNAPERIRLSIVFLFRICGSTRRQNAGNEANGPLARRSSTIWPTAPAPIPRTADSP